MSIARRLVQSWKQDLRIDNLIFPHKALRYSLYVMACLALGIAGIGFAFSSVPTVLLGTLFYLVVVSFIATYAYKYIREHLDEEP